MTEIKLTEGLMKQTAAWRRKVREAAKKAGWKQDRIDAPTSLFPYFCAAWTNDDCYIVITRDAQKAQAESAAYAAAAVLLGVEGDE